MAVKVLNVLLVENSVEDAEYVQQVLKEGGLSFDCFRTTTISTFRDALLNKNWDVVLSDCSLPKIDAETILSELVIRKLKIPLIVVSSHVSEAQAAATLMAKGAYDFLMKSNLARLVSVIRRSVLEAENCQKLSYMQLALKESESCFRAVTANLPGVVFRLLMAQDHTIHFLQMNEASDTLLGLSPEALIKTPTLLSELVLSDDRKIYDQLMISSAKHLTVWNWEGRIQARNSGGIKWISLRATPKRLDDGTTVWDGIIINITRNKLAEIEIARSREQLAELSSYLLKVKEHERARIAHEIHDDIGGTLTAIRCELLPCMNGASRQPDFYRKKAIAIDLLVNRVIDSTRRIALDLRPDILDCGIVAAIRWQAKEFINHTSIPCQIFCSDDEIDLDPDLSVAIFRIFQETLTNISKHAKASRVEVKLAGLNKFVLLEVADNGSGITNLDMEGQDSFGIRGMRERCQQLKGSFYIAGKPGKGTRITIRIPLLSNNKRNEFMQSDDLNDISEETLESKYTTLDMLARKIS
ncbi:PAS domain S-box-containing protein [Nitrosomonas cryotolerans]|uniref:histidine kinase n=1 Tax=Nitrosomonas cryotolerans ATCC 49181 TaxID=1131553 RepID=A0A1N6I6F1_9PROT|nr:histidine kinase [Nitrosomonas cryotolerans]SFP91227.1 PAS domain S-box-containing protein [Nitrosomonas cryotolerans]SIO27607.1 PAS domain S-box-containing protein [Nitrosomonas cryotolerans ATCC 49181]